MRLTATLLLACILLTSNGPAMALQTGFSLPFGAGSIEEPVDGGDAAHQGDGMSLSEAVEQVRRQYNGTIVSAETKIRGGRETHIIKVLTEDGKVKTVTVPGRRV